MEELLLQIQNELLGGALFNFTLRLEFSLLVSTVPVGSHPDEEDVGNAELDDIMDEDYDEDPMGFRDYDLDDR